MDASAQQRKVFVSRRAEEDGIRPGFVYREAPDAPWDSGWRAVVGDESRAEADDPDSIVVELVRDVVARWPELRAVFESRKPGGAWRWDPAAQVYVHLPNA
jgi:hypothetical protein